MVCGAHKKRKIITAAGTDILNTDKSIPKSNGAFRTLRVAFFLPCLFIIRTAEQLYTSIFYLFNYRLSVILFARAVHTEPA